MAQRLDLPIRQGGWMDYPQISETQILEVSSVIDLMEKTNQRKMLQIRVIRIVDYLAANLAFAYVRIDNHPTLKDAQVGDYYRTTYDGGTFTEQLRKNGEAEAR